MSTKKKSHLPKRETARIYGAFIFYWGLGGKRSLKSVQEKYRISLSAAKKWSIAFNWQARLSDMDRMVSEKLEAEAVNEAAKIRKAHISIASNLTGRLMQFLNDNKGETLIESMQDLERLYFPLVKTQLLLTEKPTEITGQTITVISAVPSHK